MEPLGTFWRQTKKIPHPLSFSWTQARTSQNRIMIFLFCSWHNARKRRSMQRLNIPAAPRKSVIATQTGELSRFGKITRICQENATKPSQRHGLRGYKYSEKSDEIQKTSWFSLAPLHYKAFEGLLMAKP